MEGGEGINTKYPGNIEYVSFLLWENYTQWKNPQVSWEFSHNLRGLDQYVNKEQEALCWTEK